MCGCPFTEEDFREAYSKTFTPNEATLELVRQLKPHYRIALLADTFPWHFEEVIHTLPIFPLFDAVALSYEVGRVRPEPGLWNEVLQKLRLMAEECVYIDDCEAFALEATKRLMHGLAFTQPIALLSSLHRMELES